MRVFLFLWTTLRSAFEAAVWAALIWTAAESFYPMNWIPLFWICFAILFIAGLPSLGASPWPMLIIDPMLVGMAILQAAMCSFVATVITCIVAYLVHTPANWLNVLLFFGTGFYILWRRNGKKRAIQAWKGEPMPEWKPSGPFMGPTPIDHLPEWQRKRLEEYREQRVLKKVEPGRGMWSRDADGSFVTEVGLYWAQVLPWKDGKVGFTAYSKKSGQMAQFSADYDTEKQAMAGAVAWMLRGQSPAPMEDLKAEPTHVRQAETDRLRTERDLIEAIDLGARKINERTADFVPEGDEKSGLLIKMYIEYLSFFVHVTNRLASNAAAYEEVDKMYNALVPLVVVHVLSETFRSVNEAARQEFAKAIPMLIQAREKQYAQSKEFASKEWKPLSGTSTVDLLVRNISSMLDTYNPEILFQIQLAARESVHEAKIPELIANYRKAHPLPE